MFLDLKKTAAFGVAGNFTGHLEQAGEASDFAHLNLKDAAAPKALFPTYIPKSKGLTPEFLTVFPFDSYRIIFPKGEEKLQIEPELVISFDVGYENEKVISLTPESFTAGNDCSIRKQGARKISMKKNWGPSSKGIGSHFIKIDQFAKGGILDRYRIASFLVRGGLAHIYGEDSAVRDYSYFYDTLLDWLIQKLNFQEDEGPAEKISDYLKEADCPRKIIISVGATRYTEYGEHNFLKDGDKAVVVVYPEDIYSFDEICHRVNSDNLEEDDICVLMQEVVLDY